MTPLAALLAGAALLGATLTPVLVGPDDEEVTVVSRSTVRVTVSWEATDGWEVSAPDRAVLDPGEASTVRIVARGGPEGRIRAMLAPFGAEGADVAALVLEAKPAPAPSPWRLPIVLVLLAVAVAAGIGGVAAALRRR